MVAFTPGMARDPGTLTPADFRAMERAGFSKEELPEMIGIACPWNFSTTPATLMDAGLREE